MPPSTSIQKTNVDIFTAVGTSNISRTHVYDERWNVRAISAEEDKLEVWETNTTR